MQEKRKEKPVASCRMLVEDMIDYFVSVRNRIMVGLGWQSRLERGVSVDDFGYRSVSR